jgi:hypothetical protein
MDYYLQVNLWRCVSSTCSSTPSVGSVISLPCSKAGQRSGSQEAIAVRDALTLQLLDTLVSVQKPAPGDPVWPKTSQLFRQEFRRMCVFFGIISQQFKPYSLRRGGATFLLQAGMPLESILLRGRWKSLPSGDSTLRTDWRNSRRCALLRRCNCELLAGRRKLLPRPFGHNFWGRGTRAGQ